MWGYVQREVNKAGCRTFPEFKAKVEETFKNLSQRHLTRLFASMKDRISQCLTFNGGKTKYKKITKCMNSFHRGWKKCGAPLEFIAPCFVVGI